MGRRIVTVTAMQDKVISICVYALVRMISVHLLNFTTTTYVFPIPTYYHSFSHFYKFRTWFAFVLGSFFPFFPLYFYLFCFLFSNQFFIWFLIIYLIVTFISSPYMNTFKQMMTIKMIQTVILLKMKLITIVKMEMIVKTGQKLMMKNIVLAIGNLFPVILNLHVLLEQLVSQIWIILIVRTTPKIIFNPLGGKKLIWNLISKLMG